MRHIFQIFFSVTSSYFTGPEGKENAYTKLLVSYLDPLELKQVHLHIDMQ